MQKNNILLNENQRQSISGKIFEDLKMGILELRFPPGSFISDRMIAQQEGVSRTPVREALKRLSQEGWIVWEERKRAMVLSRATLVILDVQPETVLTRAENEKGARPLLDSSNVRALMIKRRPAYSQCHIRVVTDRYSVSSVTDRVLEGLYGTPAVRWRREPSASRG
jgi:DNA-binding transcriptional regulator YhcF (GntR family)